MIRSRLREETIRTVPRRTTLTIVLAATMSLTAAGCGDADTSTDSTASPPATSTGVVTTTPASETTEPTDTEPTDTEPTDTELTDTVATTDAPTTAPTTPATTADTTTTSGSTTSTSSPATLPSSTIVPPTTIPTALPVRLDNWPAIPTGITHVEDVPRLLPAGPIDGVDDAIRTEFAGDLVDRPSYQQIWVSAVDDALFQIATYPTADPYATPDAEPVEVAPWTTASSGPAGEGFAFLTLTDGDGHVQVSGQNLTEEQIIDAARTMTRRADATPGWNVEPPTASMQLIGQGWDTRFVRRDVNFYDDRQLTAELSIVHGNTDLLTASARPYTDSDIMLVDIDGSPAVVQSLPSAGDDPVTLVLWSPDPDLVVYLGIRAPTDDAVEVARTLQSVDQTTWQSVSRLPDAPSDGCNGFLC